VLAGDGEFASHIVGTSLHQATLEYLFGRTSVGVHRYCAALLTPQPNNPHDRKAVAVMIYELEVGHLERDVAPDFLRALCKGGFADAACEALILGGWKRSGHDWGDFSVRLNASTPFRIYPVRNGINGREITPIHEWRRIKPDRTGGC
jgi:hypothetical protein